VGCAGVRVCFRILARCVLLRDLFRNLDVFPRLYIVLPMMSFVRGGDGVYDLSQPQIELGIFYSAGQGGKKTKPLPVSIWLAKTRKMLGFSGVGGFWGSQVSFLMPGGNACWEVVLVWLQHFFF